MAPGRYWLKGRRPPRSSTPDEACEHNEAGQRRLNSKETTRLDLRNGVFGHFPILAGDSVYVPASASGKQRVPLVEAFGHIADWRAFAHHYGVVLLAVAETWSEIRRDGLMPAADGMNRIDDALRQVLSTSAIDPDKIAIVGMSKGANLSVLIGCENLDVFSRIGLMPSVSPDSSPCDDTVRPPSGRAPFFLNAAITEGVGAFLDMAHNIRGDGHTLEHDAQHAGHAGRQLDRGDLLQWLANSWGLPRATTEVAVATAGTMLPLTTDGLSR